MEPFAFLTRISPRRQHAMRRRRIWCQQLIRRRTIGRPWQGNTQMIRRWTIGRPCQQMIRRCQQMIRRRPRQENTQMIRNISSRWDHLWSNKRGWRWTRRLSRLTFWEHRCRRRSDALKIKEFWRRWWVYARFIWPDHISTFHRSRPSLLDFLHFSLLDFLQFHRWPGFDRHTNVNQLY